MASSESIIVAEDLVVRYGTRTVLDGISFEVTKGEVFVILGGSGSGKTTLLRNLVGLMRPAEGRILIKGEDFTAMAEERRLELRKKMGMSFQGSALLESLSVADNVALPRTALVLPALLRDQYGDPETVERHHSALARWVEHMLGYMKDGIISRDTYGDWCVPPKDPSLIHAVDPGRKTDPGLLATVLFHQCLTTLVQGATQLGRQSEAERYSTLAEKVGQAFHLRFFVEEMGCYGNGSATSSVRSRVTAMPCSGSSSMQPTTSAAPNLRAIGTTRSNRSRPSSRLIELMIALPWL